MLKETMTHRPIKFRVWDRSFRKWRGPELLMSLGSGEIYNRTFSGEIIYWGSDSDSAQIVLQQYTGLKDCNGNEIFEGDIVTIADSAAPWIIEYRSGVFVWSNGQFCNYLHSDYHRVVVIGNIFDTPWLVSKETTP